MPKLHPHLDGKKCGGPDIDGQDGCPRAGGRHDIFCEEARGMPISYNKDLTYLLASAFIDTSKGASPFLPPLSTSILLTPINDNDDMF